MSRKKDIVPESGKPPALTSSGGEVAAFVDRLRQASAGGGGRLVFALDATASRQPTWDRASQLQSEMFTAAAGLGGLAVQLVFYRGFRECRASQWTREASELLRRMKKVSCVAGHTQLERVLRHAAREARKERVSALVFIGDALEERIDDVGDAAGELGLLGVPCFLFHEGDDPAARRGFEQVAKLTGGACCRFDANSAEELKALLGAVAAYAAGGKAALLAYGQGRRGPVALLTQQVR